MKCLTFLNIYLCFPSPISSKPFLSGISAEQLDMLSLLLWWTLPNTAGSVSPFLFHPFASTNTLFCITKVSCTVWVGLWRGLAQIIRNNDKWFISVGLQVFELLAGVGLCCTLFPAKLHKYLISCKNLSRLQFALLKSISLFLSLYKGFVSAESTAPNNIVIVSLMS